MRIEIINSNPQIIPIGFIKPLDIVEATENGFQSVSLCPNLTDGERADFYFSYDAIDLATLEHHRQVILESTEKDYSLRQVYQILIEEMGGCPVIKGYVANFADVRELVCAHQDAGRLTAQLIERVSGAAN